MSFRQVTVYLSEFFLQSCILVAKTKSCLNISLYCNGNTGHTIPCAAEELQMGVLYISSGLFAIPYWPILTNLQIVGSNSVL